MKKETGITLVALVITIIVMLILAGVAISMITGGDGLFAKANNAVEKYNTASKNEADIINSILTSGGINTPDITQEDIIVTRSPEDWTNESVEVEISSKIDGYNLQYSIDNGTTWNEYTRPIIVEKNNQIILVRLASWNSMGEATEIKITNIDTIVPTTATIASSNVSTTAATITATGADGEKTEISGKSGISKYVFYVDGVEYKTVETTEETTSIELTFTADSHNCYVRVYDRAGNYLDSTTATVTKHVHTDACYNWTTKVGRYVLFIDYSNKDYEEYDFKCDLCGKLLHSFVDMRRY